MKPGVFSQLYIQLIFAVKYHDRLLMKEFRDEVFTYIGGIIKERRNKPIIVNGTSNHIHIFLGLNPDEKTSELVGSIKRSSSDFINDHKWLKGRYQWQDGYGVFSYSKSHIDNVYKYIQNQEAHHKIKTFREEYEEFLRKYEIEYDPRYLFTFFD